MADRRTPDRHKDTSVFDMSRWLRTFAARRSSSNCLSTWPSRASPPHDIDVQKFLGRSRSECDWELISLRAYPEVLSHDAAIRRPDTADRSPIRKHEDRRMPKSPAVARTSRAGAALDFVIAAAGVGPIARRGRPQRLHDEGHQVAHRIAHPARLRMRLSSISAGCWQASRPR